MDGLFFVLVLYWIVFTGYSAWVLRKPGISWTHSWDIGISSGSAILSFIAALSMEVGWDTYTDISVYINATYMPIIIPRPSPQPGITGVGDITFLISYTMINAIIGFALSRLFQQVIHHKNYWHLIPLVTTLVLKTQAEFYVVFQSIVQG